MTKVTVVFVTGLLTLILYSACSFNGDKYLGAHYWFWADGGQSEIVYGKEASPQDGFTIIDANVSEYNYNDSYIIVRSNWLIKNGKDTYWIINKRVNIINDTSLKGEIYKHAMKMGVIGPLNRDSFEILLTRYKITLKLKATR